MDLEKKKDLLGTGKQFQDQIESVTSHVEAIMKGYLSNYKVEYKTPLNSEYLQIYNPKMDLESVIFNTNVDNSPRAQPQILPQPSFKKKKSKSFINMPDSFEFDFKATIKKTDDPKVFSSDEEFVENDKDLENDIVEQELLDELNIEKSREEPTVVQKAKTVKRNSSNFLGVQSKNFIRKSNSPLPTTSKQKINPYQPNIVHRPISNRKIMGSPKETHKRNTMHYAMYKSDNKSLNALRKSSQNITAFREKSNTRKEVREKSMKNKIKKRDSALYAVKKRKSQIGMPQVEKQGNLKKLLSGKHAQKIKLLKDNSLICLDLNFGGKLSRI